MKLFKISILVLVLFGIVHFLSDKILVKLVPLDTYLAIKFWTGKITIALTIIVVGSLLYMLIKFLFQKRDAK